MLHTFTKRIRSKQRVPPTDKPPEHWSKRTPSSKAKIPIQMLLAHFTEEACRSYQYDLAGRELKTGTIRVRMATVASFGKWMVRRDKLVRNPVDRLTRPRADQLIQ